MPYLAFKSWEIIAFDNDSLLVDPNPRGVRQAVLGVSEQEFSIQSIGNFPAFVSKRTILAPEYREFFLSIPKLKLEKIKVLTNSNDFSETLAQLPGTAMPGEKGNLFITGHSSLPINLDRKLVPFFKDLPNIKSGDEIILEAGNQKFIYTVMGLKIVDPKDISVIEPPEGLGRYLTLMTCVPPGFNTKRLIVLSKIKI
ncbi:MAG: Sortase (Surface protein transpeptidase) [Candidatus Daviesbacteria bacterium GW2011_GWA1_36_8]|nr:MAG: Sortase (Surface protein transpeptidase) [Candidatus Daviesbacteria bacterium GW2011_GWB1_36_5]KKQ16350.1 MAG: Sortase (Surface protein transpeptidase) [Candidatus Daviesbacteria bacterium GW2011_GWA1_36_8]